MLRLFQFHLPKKRGANYYIKCPTQIIMDSESSTRSAIYGYDNSKACLSIHDIAKELESRSTGSAHM
ncbi:hypothetical protein HI914_03905 [Erysiphe necator]|nr:hypothetical protein HI914_03905 [Erysiphe necator]